MTNGDKRYLGDVFINEENRDIQNQFFRDIINSYQWKFGGEFDASTLQGKTPADFATADQGELAERALLSPLCLGHTKITNKDEVQYIMTDAVTMYYDKIVPESDRTLEDVDWFNNLIEAYGADDLTAALMSIYDNVMDIEARLEENKLDKNIFYNFKTEEFDPLEERVNNVFETFEDEFGNEVHKLDSDLTNGLRFILITQEAYDDLDGEEKNYWRNIYIIRDPEDIPPEYVDPMTWQLKDGYKFRVHNGELQVNNGLSSEWAKIADISDLFSQGGFDAPLKDFLENNETFIINNISLIESLKNLDGDDETAEYPFLSSSLHDDYVFDITVNGSYDNVNDTVNNANFKTININLNNFLTPLQEDIGDLDTELRRVISNQDTMTNDITGIKNLNNQQNNQLNIHMSNIQKNANDITALNNRIANFESSINNRINNLLGWSVQHIYNEPGKEVKLYKLPAARIAMVTFNVNNVKFKDWKVQFNKTLPECFPMHQITGQMTDANVTVTIEGDGTITAKSTVYGKGVTQNVWGAIFYPYN